MDTFEKVLESDMARIATEIKLQRENPEMKNLTEQEVLKNAIRSFPELNTTPAAVGTVPLPHTDDNSPLPAYAQSAPPESRLEIEYLLDLALKKGIGPALTESAKSPAFVQDAFHDALAGKLYPELQKRGIVK
jgi:hypothetical protein